MDTNKEITLAWFSGLFEGEGTFTFRYGEATAIAITLTDLDVLQKVQSLYGGIIYTVTKRQPHWKDAWIWKLTGSQAVELIKLMLPYLGERRKDRGQQWLDSYNNMAKARQDRADEISRRSTLIRELYATGKYTHQQIADLLQIDRTTVSHTLRGRY